MNNEAFPWQSPTRAGADFEATRWTDLRAVAVGRDPVKQRDALERLCRAYWKPIYAFIRRQGQAPDAARDLTQDFFHHLLRKERLKLVDQRRGRFRSFILAALRNFLASDWDRRSARKRDERQLVSLDVDLDSEGEQRFEPRAGDETPDRMFDRLWAIDLLATVRSRLEAELASPDKRPLRRLLPTALHEDRDCRYAELAVELGKSEDAVKKAIERLRTRWETLLREEVATTVQVPEDVEMELRELLVAIGRG